MDLYHSWFYVKILNTSFFVWLLVIVIGILNLLSPILLWLVFNGKKVWSRKEKGDQTNQTNQSNQANESTN